MDAALSKKLQYKSDFQGWVFDVPQDWTERLGGLVAQSGTNWALFFVRDPEGVAEAATWAQAHLVDDALLWMAYPKKSSRRYTSSVYRDAGWEALGAAGWEPVSQVALDEDWSALRFRRIAFIPRFNRGFAISAEGQRRIQER
ncbi:hypothetical protein GC167_09670 [bacterium]|nr:hypothetical protein [bacterium]